MEFGEDRATVDRMDWAADAVAGPPTPLLFVSVARPYMASLERSYRRALARDDAAAVAVAVEAAAFAQRAVAVFHAIDALYGDGPVDAAGAGHSGTERRSTGHRPGTSGLSSLLWSGTGASGGRGAGGAGTSMAGTSTPSAGGATTSGADGRRRAPAAVAAAEQLAAAVRRDDPGRFSAAEAAAVPYLLRAKARLFEAVRSRLV